MGISEGDSSNGPALCVPFDRLVTAYRQSSEAVWSDRKRAPPPSADDGEITSIVRWDMAPKR